MTLWTLWLFLVRNDYHCTMQCIVDQEIDGNKPVKYRDNFVKQNPGSKSINLRQTHCKSPYFLSLIPS